MSHSLPLPELSVLVLLQRGICFGAKLVFKEIGHQISGNADVALTRKISNAKLRLVIHVHLKSINSVVNAATITKLKDINCDMTVKNTAGGPRV